MKSDDLRRNRRSGLRRRSKPEGRRKDRSTSDYQRAHNRVNKRSVYHRQRESTLEHDQDMMLVLTLMMMVMVMMLVMMIMMTLMMSAINDRLKSAISDRLK